MLGIPGALGVAFALMAFTTFVYDTLDVCTRLGRYIMQELTGWHDAEGRWIGTRPDGRRAAVLPDATARSIPHGKADSRLEDVLVAVRRQQSIAGRADAFGRDGLAVANAGRRWVWFVTGIPTVFMYTMSTWALVQIIGHDFGSLVASIAMVLLALAALMAVEAVVIFVRGGSPPRGEREPEVELASA